MKNRTQHLKCAIGNFGGEITAGNAVFIKLRRQNSKISVIFSGRNVTDYTIKSLAHVHTGEVGIEHNIAHEIRNGMPCHVFGLAKRCPCAGIQGSCAAGSGLRTGFPLNQFYRRIILMEQCLASRHKSRQSTFICRVVVIGESIHDLSRSCCEDIVQPRQTEQALTAADDFCVRIRSPDRLGGAQYEMPVIGTIGAGFPTPDPIGFVPYLVPLHFAPVTGDDGFDVPVPGAVLFFRPGRMSDSAENLCGFFIVKPVAVAETDPGLHVPSDQIVHNPVKPFKRIDAFFLFGSCPAGLNPHPFGSCCGDFIVGLFRIKHTAVEFLEPDADAGMCDFGG